MNTRTVSHGWVKPVSGREERNAQNKSGMLMLMLILMLMLMQGPVDYCDCDKDG